MPLTDFTTDVAKVRALIPDTEEVPNPNAPLSAPEFIFPDGHLQAFLDLNGGDIRLAASDACAALGTSEAIIAKVIKTEDLQTDGAKIMGQFLARAKQLRDQAADIDGTDGVDGFDIIPYTVPSPNRYYWIG